LAIKGIQGIFMTGIDLSLCSWLKRYQVGIGGVLIAIAIPVCSVSWASIPTSSCGSPVSTAIEPLRQQAVQVIRNYYSAIARQDYQQAYLAWDQNGAASQQSFEQFKQGFANTACVAVEVGEPGQPDGAAGSSYIQIPVTVTAITRDGMPQRFRGSYVLRRVNDVPGSTPEQRRWHLYSANITQTN
jgi:hypothetical protein